MIKPAAQLTTTGVFAVCATPTTLASNRYAELRRLYAGACRILEPDCSNWAMMIEHNRTNELELSKLVHDLRRKQADVIVLGCTHYHWIEEELQALSAPDIKVIQPIQPVLDQLARVLTAQKRS